MVVKYLSPLNSEEFPPSVELNSTSEISVGSFQLRFEAEPAAELPGLKDLFASISIPSFPPSHFLF